MRVLVIICEDKKCVGLRTSNSVVLSSSSSLHKSITLSLLIFDFSLSVFLQPLGVRYDFDLNLS